MTANFSVWDDLNNEWMLNVKTPNGKLRHLIVKDDVIAYCDENWNTLINIT